MARLYNADVISMPDKWEYPWVSGLGTWPSTASPWRSSIPDFAKEQLVLMTREWYMHPNSRLPP